jgi:hypothetical protein
MSPKLARLRILSLLVLLGFGVVTGYFLANFSKPVRADGPADSANEIERYRTWTRVNPTPYLMRVQSAIACAAPSAPMPNVKNPHQDKYVTVYVNDIGRKAMLEMKSPNFPEGSIIVKEKLSEPSSAAPELLTVMIKHSKGYNPDLGDWEFMVTDGTGSTVQARGRLENCQACHTTRPQNDFIFRSYLPDEVANKLR